MSDDAPIEPHIDLKVVDIGDFKVSRGMARYEKCYCPHQRMVYDINERRVWCSECNSTIDPFEAFQSIVRSVERRVVALSAERLEIEQTKKFTARTNAARNIETAWRKRNTQPACPACDAFLDKNLFAKNDFPQRKVELKQ